MNFAVLQRLDPKISRILGTAGHVVLYKFLIDKQDWSRREVEGSLFVVERTVEPHHMILVLNRISLENFCEPVVHKLQMRVSEPFLLLRNEENDTTGVWFYSKEEQIKISQIIKTLLDAKKTRLPTNPKGRPPALPPLSSGDSNGSTTATMTAAAAAAAPATNAATSGQALLPLPSPLSFTSNGSHRPQRAHAPPSRSPPPLAAQSNQHNRARSPQAHGSNAAGAALLNLLLRPSPSQRAGPDLGPPGAAVPPHLLQTPRTLFPSSGQPASPYSPYSLHSRHQHYPMPTGHIPLQAPLLPQQPHPPYQQPQQSVQPMPPHMRFQPQQPQQAVPTKEQLRSVLAALVNDDNFINLVHESYKNQLSA